MQMAETLAAFVGAMLTAKMPKIGEHYKSHVPHGKGKAKAKVRRRMAQESRRRNRAA